MSDRKTILIPFSKTPEGKEEQAKFRRPSSMGQDTYDVFFDNDRDVAFAGTPDGAHWIDYSDIRRHLRPKHIFTTPMELRAKLGESIEVDLSYTNPKEQLRVVATDAPDGLSIEGRRLKWKTTPRDVGRHLVKLELKSSDGKQTLDTTTIDVSIDPPTIDAGMMLTSIAFSPDRKRAVVWGYDPSPTNDAVAFFKGSGRVAILDLETVSVVSTKEVMSGVKCAAIDSDFVYLTPASSRVIHRYDHNFDNLKREFLQSAGSPVSLVPLPSNRLFVGGSQPVVLSRKTLKPAETIVSTDAFRVESPPAVLKATQLKTGRRIEVESGELQRFDAEELLPSIGGFLSKTWPLRDRTKVNVSSFKIALPVERRWGHYCSELDLYNGLGERIEPIGSVDSVDLSERWPIAVSLLSRGSSSVSEGTVLDVQIKGLRDNKVLFEFSIKLKLGSARMKPRLLPCGDNIALVHGNEIQLIPIPKAVVADLEIPPVFANAQPRQVQVGERETLRLGVHRPSSRIQFVQLRETPEVRLDPESGEFQVDTVALWDRFCEWQALATVGASQGSRSASGSPLELFDVERNRENYLAMTGSELPSGMMAAYLPMTFLLRSQRGFEDCANFSLLVVGPRSTYDAAVAKKNEAARLKQEQAEALNAAADASKPTGKSKRPSVFTYRPPSSSQPSASAVPKARGSFGDSGAMQSAESKATTPVERRSSFAPTVQTRRLSDGIGE
ncbi:MAG: hypothetical protein AAFX06_33440, partial [Planctomycetota bacterium]